MLIIRVLFKISFEVISVLLLLLGEASKEESVIRDPSLIFGLDHASFSPIVLVRVVEFASIELFNAVELTVENIN